MKQKYTKSEITAVLLKLEYAKNALEAHKNFNLAEVHIEEYMQKCPKALVDSKIKKIIKESLEQRNHKLLALAVDSEIERLSTLKIKLLREKITQS